MQLQEKFMFRLGIKVVFFLVGLASVQVLFFSIQVANKNSIVLALNSMLNNEQIVSNPYSLSQGIENLEFLGLLRCSKVILKDINSSFIDTTFRGNCHSNILLLNGVPIKFSLTAINGSVWGIEAIANNSSEFQYFLWLSRVFVLASIALLIKFHNSRIIILTQKKDMEIAKRQFVAESANQIANNARQVAHDIRAPLSALELALYDANLSEDKKSQLISVSKRIQGIANDLLEKSKRNAHSILGNNVLNSNLLESSFSINEIISEVVSEKKIKAANIAIFFDASGIFNVTGVDTQFQRVLSNILDNSIEALSNREHPAITIRVKDFKTNIGVFISDNGCGIPSHVVPRVGEPGFSFGKKEGNGLGISYSKSVLQEWGGDLQIASKENDGTMVTIRLLRTQQSSL